MFGWRKKNDGFVWHEYVRTTILVRRDERRQKIEQIRESAVEGVKQAGRHGAAATASGARMAALATVRALATAYYASTDALIATASATWLWLCNFIGRSEVLAPLRSAAAWIWPAWQEAASNTGTVAPALLVGAICAASAVARWRDHGMDPEALITSSIAMAAAIFAAAPRVSSALSGASELAGFPRLAWPSRISVDLKHALKLALVVGFGAMSLSWLVPALSSGTPVPHVSDGKRVLVAASGVLEGKATVLTGDQLRLSGSIVRLFGIEAPEAGQSCPSSGRKTESCGQAAKAALQRLVSGKTVTCEVSTRQSESLTTATCKVAGADIAGQLVRAGQVFAATGLFATYASAEREAKAARAGIWRVELDRPADFRAKAWNDSKDQSPEGCPIKAVVSGDQRTYLMPWSPGYERTKVRASRGERWFCTEAEARSAGWQPADPG